MAGFSVPVSSWLYQGLPASGGSLYVYKTGTTTFVTIYSDAALTSPITNPTLLDANGQAKFYVSGSTALRFDGYTVGGMATGTFIESIDPVFPISATGIGTVIDQSTNLTLSTTNNGNNIIATAPITISLPQTTTFSNSFSVQLNAQGGAITLAPFASDRINLGTAGANFVLTQGQSGQLWTDANGNWGINFLTVSATTQPVGDNTTKIATDAFVQANRVVFNAISGLLPSAQTFTSNVIASMTITAGQAADSTNSYMLSGGSFAWNITNGNAINGFSGGTTLPNGSTVHFFIIAKPDFSAFASFAAGSTTPTLPTGYTLFRRIFSLNTNSSGVLLAGTAIETDGGSMLYWLATQILDINVTTQGTSRVAYTLTVPQDIKVEPKYRNNSAVVGQAFIFTSGDETDVAPTGNSTTAFTTAPGFDMSSNPANSTISGTAGDHMLTTSTLGQIGCRAASGSTNSLYWVTRGFRDWRRK